MNSEVVLVGHSDKMATIELEFLCLGGCYRCVCRCGCMCMCEYGGQRSTLDAIPQDAMPFVVVAAAVLFVCLDHFQTYPTNVKFTDIFCGLGILLDGHCGFDN